jgi:thiamine kinase-like enzyme
LDGQKIPVIRIHGDFAPWNTMVKGDNLFVFDWEYSESDGIPFYDIIYWNLQVMLLLKKRSGFEIFRELKRKTRCNILPEISGGSLKAYFLWSIVDIFTHRIGETENDNEYLKKLFDICIIMVGKS